MIKLCDRRKILFRKWVSFAKMYSTSEPVDEVADATETVCKVMMSCPTLALDTALNQTGVRVSPDLVENVLRRFENAGMSAFRFFEWAEKQRSYSHPIKAYHLMIESLAKIRQYQIMWDLVNAMRQKGMLNVETFCIMMRKYARANKVDEAIYTFNVMDKYDVSPNLAAFNGLLSALCKSKNVRKAQEIFDAMKGRFVLDSKTYSILLEGWGKAPNLPRAREVFREMVRAGCDPDVVTYGIMVDILCKVGRVDEAVEVVKEMDARNCRPTSFIYSVLVHTYGVEHRIEDAIDTFLEMERKGIKADVVVYNALIGAFCKVNKFKNVHRVLKEMECNGIAPNSRTCNVIISSMISQGQTDRAFRVFRRMIKLCEPDADTYTMMIKMFCERKELEMALKIWRYMKSKQFVPSMHTFSALINGLCENGNVAKACVLLEEMMEKGMRPSRVTFGRLRQLLIKDGREDVLKFLHEKMNLLVKEPLYD
ncbi:pentatricopeptide repeat-containing protein At1g77360, mitochondrial [Abrus precatorius]|uniref:Pentatricopeptide repeat-containing protein At1g77360, mitochondrial n=1 Tax=Abrus precatorius TaxID=3816 RepID=A0A8B8K5Q0_ABRPR|nr:pentatricopeptide repeat-containing protein At1g77360, mitochondrial [Abrus precatorius]XP_027338423.1 pentatricopeptide repeat-containing protein At1g77360, mitochondrial [Abrus precatorius]